MGATQITAGNERLLRQDRLATRSIVSRHVARVLIAEPEQWADWTIYEVLNRIPYVSRARISRFCAKAGLNPLRLGSELSPGQRLLLARLLTDFAKESE